MNDRKRANDQAKYAQLAVRIRAQEALVRKLKNGTNVTAYDDARRQLNRLRKERTEIAERLG